MYIRDDRTSWTPDDARLRFGFITKDSEGRASTRNKLGTTTVLVRARETLTNNPLLDIELMISLRHSTVPKNL